MVLKLAAHFLNRKLSSNPSKSLTNNLKVNKSFLTFFLRSYNLSYKWITFCILSIKQTIGIILLVFF